MKFQTFVFGIAQTVVTTSRTVVVKTSRRVVKTTLEQKSLRRSDAAATVAPESLSDDGQRSRILFRMI